jgi:hypothetical protein
LPAAVTAMFHPDTFTQVSSALAHSPERMADNDRKGRNGPGTAVITKTKPQTKRPNLYRVLILNDDYTPMEFVVHVLEKFFGRDHEAATRIMCITTESANAASILTKLLRPKSRK